jgi:two-component system, LuxR family, sensor kinase FixL
MMPSCSRASMAREVARLQEGIMHAASVVSSHRTIARGAAVDELFAPVEVAEAALRLSMPSASHPAIAIERRFEDGPLLRGDKNKVLQILINLLSNAQHALLTSPRQDKRLLFATERHDGSSRFIVTDNGVGFGPEMKGKLFRQRFSTRSDGSGLGLHTSALLAEQMGASLGGHSEGEGRGATFILELSHPAAADLDAVSQVASR